jgi:hypothetical protein
MALVGGFKMGVSSKSPPFGFEPHLAWGSSVTSIPAGLRVAKAPSWARPLPRVKEKERERKKKKKKKKKEEEKVLALGGG